MGFWGFGVYLTKESAVYRYAYDHVASFIAAHDEDDFSL